MAWIKHGLGSLPPIMGGLGGIRAPAYKGDDSSMRPKGNDSAGLPEGSEVLCASGERLGG